MKKYKIDLRLLFFLAFIIYLLLTACTNATIGIKDIEGSSHYYGKELKEDVEMWCLIHQQYEKVEIK